MPNCKNCQLPFKQFSTTQVHCSRKCYRADKGKSTSLKKKSVKRESEEEIYSTLRKQYLEIFPICPITGLPTTDIHHMAGRIGYADENARLLDISLYLDVRYWCALSRQGHQFVEENPEWAKENGYSFNRNQKLPTHEIDFNDFV